MAWRIGIDEAGLGPNLGPFVVSAVVWEIPDDVGDVDLWAVFPDILTQDPRDRRRLAVADSKAVFQPHHGLDGLERSVLALLGSRETVPRTLADLHTRLGTQSAKGNAEPWIATELPALPCDADLGEIRDFATRWSEVMSRCGWRFHTAVSAVVSPREFNQRLDNTGNKAEVTSGVHAAVLRCAWEQAGDGAVTVFSDKHGGRNRYGSVLADVFPSEWVDVVAEGADSSRYRVGRTQLHFEPRAEHHAVVALASMISKYLRELHMQAFNRFWCRDLPDLKPTQGYPVDAKRFFAAIAPRLESQGLTKVDVWRYK